MSSQIKCGLAINSPAFHNNSRIPSKYTCEGENISPPFYLGDTPSGTKSLVLIVEDPDAPGGTFDHWIMWNILPVSNIGEDSSPGIEGMNSAGEKGYRGPCPPSGEHRYFFILYALDTMLDLRPGADKNSLLKAIEGHILASGELVGTYKKKKQNK